jgi:hypothetical protein
LIGLGFLDSALGDSGKQIEAFSVADSRSVLESTFSFPIALIAVFSLMKRRYFQAALFALFVVIFLKRIALGAVAVSIIIWLLPYYLKRVILSPWSVTAAVLVAVVLCIEFANGTFDREIFEIFGQSANDFSKGRRVLWESALVETGFSYPEFLFVGVGFGGVVAALAEGEGRQALLHNDLLSLVIEVGIVPFFVFVYLLVRSRDLAHRLLAANLLIFFLTDNVLIYQHVVFVYLLLQAQVRGGFWRASSTRVSGRSQRHIEVSSDLTGWSDMRGGVRHGNAGRGAASAEQKRGPAELNR